MLKITGMLATVADMSFANSTQCVIDNLGTAVLLFSDNLRLMSMNPAAEALLAMSAKQVRGLHVSRLFPKAGLCVGTLVRALQAGSAITEREMRMRVGGLQTSVIVDCTITPLRDLAHPPSVLVELVRKDRHSHITREEQLLSQNDVTRGFVRRLAHEIRNPLGGLRGAAQLLSREVVDETLKEYTTIIIREADRLQNLMDRMLGPRTLPKMRPINVHEITERVRALLEAEAPTGVSIVRDYDPSIPEVHADPDLLIQAMLNVARNAVQAVGMQGNVILRTRIHRRLTIGHQRHRLVVRIDVIDDGPGIPEALRETLFYPMVTGREGGTGLGLSIAQSLVNQHGGLIEYSSATGLTTFSILLPGRRNDE
ncbi:MAG: nitrogen regulation protein NR(II) [Gammaproteobacteria bacterium]